MIAIAEELAQADPDSAEYVCLKLLETNVRQNTEHQ